MKENDKNYKFGKKPSLDRMQTALALGGLGFWRLVRGENDDIIFDPDNIFLTSLGLKKSDIPSSLYKFLEQRYDKDDAEYIINIVKDCFAGVTNSFDIKVQAFSQNVSQKIWFRIFGDVEEVNSNGQVLVLSGYSQNIQAQYDDIDEINNTWGKSVSVIERTRVMINAFPMPCAFWQITPDADKPLDPTKHYLPLKGFRATLMYRNEAALSFFEVKDKQTHDKSLLQFESEFQADGRSTIDCFDEIFKKTLKNGSHTTKWLHKKIDGTPLPCEITLVNASEGDQSIIITYTKDLRTSIAAQLEIDKAVREKEIVDARNHLMLDSIPMSCSLWEFLPESEENNNSNFPYIIVAGHRASLVEISNASLTLFGVPNKETYYQYINVFSPKIQPNGQTTSELFTNILEKALVDGICSSEFMLIHGDGSLLPCEVTATFVPNSENTTVTCFTRDLRASKAAQFELDKAVKEKDIANERNRLMLDSMPLACELWQLSPAYEEIKNRYLPSINLEGQWTTLVDVNDATLSLFEIPDKETYFNNLNNFLPEFQDNGQTTVECLIEVMKKAITTGSSTITWMQQKLDGTPIPCELTIIVVPNADNPIMLSYTRDLREIKDSQSKLHSAVEAKNLAHERHHLMLDSMPMSCGLWEFSPLDEEDKNPHLPSLVLAGHRATLVEISKNTLALFGAPDVETFYARFYTFISEFQPNGQGTLEFLDEVVKKSFINGSCIVEFQFLHSDGSPMPCEMTIVDVSNGDSKTILHFSRDLRAGKTAQFELDKAVQEKELANERNRLILDSMPLSCGLWELSALSEEDKNPHLPSLILDGQRATLMEISNNAIAFLGMPDKETYFHNFNSIFPKLQPDGQNTLQLLDEMSKKAFHEGYSANELLIMHHDGSLFPCEVTIINVSSGDKTTMLHFSRDLRTK